MSTKRKMRKYVSCRLGQKNVSRLRPFFSGISLKSVEYVSPIFSPKMGISVSASISKERGSRCWFAHGQHELVTRQDYIALDFVGGSFFGIGCFLN